MDFLSLKRKELQSLCKKHGIPANKTNREMADLLTSALKVKDNLALEEDRNEIISEDEQKTSKKVRFSPNVETREYEPSGYKKPARMTRRATKASSSLEESENNVLLNEVGNKRGRNGKMGKVSRTSRSQAKVSKEISSVTESEIETDSLDGQKNYMAGTISQKRVLPEDIDRDDDEVRKGERRLTRNRTKFADADVISGVANLNGGEARQGARRSARNGAKFTDPELVCDEVSNVDGGEAEKGARRSTRNGAKFTNPELASDVVAHVDDGELRKGARNGAKFTDPELVRDEVSNVDGGEAEEGARRSTRNGEKFTNPELVSEGVAHVDGNELRKGARNGAKFTDPELVRDEVSNVDGGEAEKGARRSTRNGAKFTNPELVSDGVAHVDGGELRKGARNGAKYTDPELLRDEVSNVDGGEAEKGARRSTRNGAKFTNPELVSDGVAHVDGGELRKGARNGAKFTYPELVRDEVSNVDGGEAGKDARRSTRNGAKFTNPELVSDGVAHVDGGELRKGARIGPKSVDSEPVNDGVVDRAGVESRKGTRRSVRNVAKCTDSEPVNEGKARKDATRSTRSGANLQNSELVKEEVVNKATRSKAQSVAGISTSEGKEVSGATAKESCKGIARATSKRKSVAQLGDAAESTLLVPNACNKRQKIVDFDVATEVKASMETTDELKKAQPPVVNPRKSRRKTVVFNSNIVAEDSAFDQAMGKEEHKDKELRRSTRRASVYVGAATTVKLNEIAEVKEISLSVQTIETTSVGSESLAVKPSPASARHGDEMKEKAMTAETAFSNISLLGVDTESTISEAAGENNNSSCHRNGVLENSKQKGKSKGKVRGKRNIDSVDVSARNSDIGVEIDTATNLTEAISSTVANDSKEEETVKVAENSVVPNEIIVLDTENLVSEGSIKGGFEDEQCQAYAEYVNLENVEETLQVAEESDNANEDIVPDSSLFSIEGEQCHSSKKCANLVNEEETLKTVEGFEDEYNNFVLETGKSISEGNIEVDADDQCQSYEKFAKSDSTEETMKVAGGSAVLNKDIALETGSLISGGHIQYASDDQCQSSKKCTNLGNEEGTLKVTVEPVAINEDIVSNTGISSILDDSAQGDADDQHRSSEKCASLDNNSPAEFNFEEFQPKDLDVVNPSNGFSLANQSTFGGQNSNYTGLKKMLTEEETPASRDSNCGSDGINGHSDEVDGMNILERLEDELDKNLIPEDGRPLQSVTAEIYTESIKYLFQETDDANDCLTEAGRSVEVDGVISDLEWNNNQDGILDEEEHGQEVHHQKASLSILSETIMEDTEDVCDSANEHSNEIQSNYVEMGETGGLEKVELTDETQDAGEQEPRSTTEKSNVQEMPEAFLHDAISSCSKLEIIKPAGIASNADSSCTKPEVELIHSFTPEEGKASSEGYYGETKNDEVTTSDNGHVVKSEEVTNNSTDNSSTGYDSRSPSATNKLNGHTVATSEGDLIDNVVFVNELSSECKIKIQPMEAGREQCLHKLDHEDGIAADTNKQFDHSFTQQKGKATCEGINGETENDNVMTSDIGKVEKSCEVTNDSTDNPSMGNDAQSHDVAIELNVHTVAMNEGDLIDNVGFANELSSECKTKTQAVEVGREQCLHKLDNEIVIVADTKETADTENLDSVSAFKDKTFDAIGDYENEAFELNLLFQAADNVNGKPSVEEMTEIGALDEPHAFTTSVVNQDEGRNSCQLKLLSPKETSPCLENDKHDIHCESLSFSEMKMTSTTDLIQTTPQNTVDSYAMEHKQAASEETIMAGTEDMLDGANEQSNVVIVERNHMKMGRVSGLERIEHMDSTDGDQFEVEPPNCHDSELSGSNSEAVLGDEKRIVQEKNLVNRDQHDFTTSVALTCEPCERINGEAENDKVITSDTGNLEKSCEVPNNSTDNPSIENDARSHDVAIQLNGHTVGMNEGDLIDNFGFVNELSSECKTKTQPLEAGREQCLHKLDDEIVTVADTKETADTENLDSVSAFKDRTFDAIGDYENEAFELNLLFQAGDNVNEKASVEEMTEIGAVDEPHAFIASVVNQDEGRNSCELKLLSPKETSPCFENDKHDIHCESLSFSVMKMTSTTDLIQMTPQKVVDPYAMEHEQSARGETIMAGTQDMCDGADEQSNVVIVERTHMKMDRVSGVERIEHMDSTDEDQPEVEPPNCHDSELSGSSSKAVLGDGKGTVQEEKQVNVDQHDFATSVALTCEETTRFELNEEKSVLEGTQMDVLPQAFMDEEKDGKMPNIAAANNSSDETCICAGEPFLSEVSDTPKSEDTQVESTLFTDIEINLFHGNREHDPFVGEDLSEGNRIGKDLEQALPVEQDHLEKCELALEDSSGCVELNHEKDASTESDGQQMQFDKASDAPGEISTIIPVSTDFPDDKDNMTTDSFFCSHGRLSAESYTLNTAQNGSLDQSVAMCGPDILKKETDISYCGDQSISEKEVCKMEKDYRAALEKINVLEEAEIGGSVHEASHEMEGTILPETISSSTIWVVNKQAEISSSAESDCSKPEMDLHHSFTLLNGKTSHDEFDSQMEEDKIIASNVGRMQKCDEHVNNPIDNPTPRDDDIRDHGEVAHEQSNMHSDALSDGVSINNAGFSDQLSCENKTEIQFMESGNEHLLRELDDDAAPVDNSEPFEDRTDDTGDSLSYETNAFELDSLFQEGERRVEKPGVEESPTKLMIIEAGKLLENTIGRLSSTRADEPNNEKQENAANFIVEEQEEELQQFEEMPEIGAALDSQGVTAEEIKVCELKLETPTDTIPHSETGNDKSLTVLERTSGNGSIPSTPQNVVDMLAMQENAPNVEMEQLTSLTSSRMSQKRRTIVQEPREEIQQLEEMTEIKVDRSHTFTTLDNQGVVAEEVKISEMKMEAPTNTSSHPETGKHNSLAVSKRTGSTGLIPSTPLKVVVSAMKENAPNVKMEQLRSLAASRMSQKRRPLEDLKKN